MATCIQARAFACLRHPTKLISGITIANNNHVPFKSSLNTFINNIHSLPNEKMQKVLPFYACGKIVRGFGRGSKELGLPTANYAEEVVRTLPETLDTGVYYGWANIDNGEVYKMVMSIGWNPFYNNKEKSMETHILHEYKKDLYGQLLKVCIVGHLRPEMNFDSLEALIAAIKGDIEQANQLLEQQEAQALRNSEFFKANAETNNGTPTTTDIDNTRSSCAKTGS